MRSILKLAFLSLVSFNALAIEGNIKVGYDFYRSSTRFWDIESKFRNVPYNRGFVVGAEILPLTFFDNRIKIGAGAEYNFGEKSLTYSEKNSYNRYYYRKYSYGKYNTIMVPVYATAKLTYFQSENKDLNFYTFARIGYAFGRETPEPYWPYKNKRYNTDGVYYGIGLGLDYKYFLAEILYDGKYSNIKREFYDPCTCKTIEYKLNDFHHKIGVRLGLQLGSQHFKKPKIKIKKIEKKIKIEVKKTKPEMKKPKPCVPCVVEKK